MKKIISIVLGLIMFSLIVAFAQEGNMQAWNAFKQNKFTEANKMFAEALNDPSLKSEALLGLMLIDEEFENGNAQKGFNYFKSFYELGNDFDPVLYGLWNNGFRNGKLTENQLVFIKQIIANSTIDGTIKAIAYQQLANHYNAIGDFQYAKENYDKIGAVDFYYAAGSFYNVSGGGFNKNHGALKHPEQEAIFKDYMGADVSWHRINNSRTDKWFDFTYHFLGEDVLYYAQTFVNSPLEQEVFLRAGVSGSLKIWINDALAITEEEERNTDLDVYATKIKLNKGSNRILVQVGKSEISKANFMIRITDDKANPIKNVNASANIEEYSASTQATFVKIPFYYENYFEEKWNKHELSFLDKLVLARIYLHNDENYKARKILNLARLDAPVCSNVTKLLIDCHARSGNETLLKKEKEFLYKNDPTNSTSLYEKINNQSLSKNYKEALVTVDSIEEIYGISSSTEFQRLIATAYLGKEKEFENMLDEVYEKYPDDERIIAIQYAYILELTKSKEKAFKILQTYLKNNNAPKYKEIMAEGYIQSGNFYKAIDLYTQLKEEYPYSSAYYYYIGNAYCYLKNYENAIKSYKQALSLTPYSGDYWYVLGIANEAAGNMEEAKKNYATTLYYNPTDYKVMSVVRELNNQKSMFEFFAKNDIDKLVEDSKKVTSDNNDGSIILLNDKKVVIYSKIAREEEGEIIVKVLTQAGIDAWKEYGISYDSYFETLDIANAYILKPDGNKIKAEVDGGKAVFISLEKNDIIYINYKIKTYRTGKLANEYWDRFYFNSTVPVIKARYSVVIPKSKKLSYKTLNNSISPVISEVDLDNQMYVFEENHPAKVVSETYMPYYVDAYSVVEVSTIEDWSIIANWYSDLSATKAKSDFEVKETVVEIFKNKINLSNFDKARVIYEYIENNINYLSVAFLQSDIIPQKASTTLNYKLGDCKDISTLFVAMCREVGLDANLALISTREYGDNYILLPSMTFNHCIAQLNDSGKIYYVELTSNELPFTALTGYLLNANALCIPNDQAISKTSLFKLSTDNRPRNAVNRKYNLQVSSSDIIVDYTAIKTGWLAQEERSIYKNRGDDEVKKIIYQTISYGNTTPLELKDYKLHNIDNLSDTIIKHINYIIYKGVSTIAGLSMLQLPWASTFTNINLDKHAKRNYPLYILEFFREDDLSEQVSIEIPKGKFLAEPLKSIKYSCSAVNYEISYKEIPGKIIATRSVQTKSDIIPPEQYSSFVDFIQKMKEADQKQIVFK